MCDSRSFWNSLVWRLVQQSPKTASAKQLPPACCKIIQEYDTPQHKTSAAHNNAHSPSLGLCSAIFYLSYLPSLALSPKIYNVAGIV